MTNGSDVPTWAEMDQDARTEYWASLALRHCRGLGALSCARLLQTFGSAYTALQERKRWAEAGLNSRQSAEMGTGSWRVTARYEWEAARRLDARILLWRDSAYPDLLRTLPDAPVLLYCLGDMSLLRTPAVAVIGSRRPTAHGCTVASHMASTLASCGISVISGMAQGIDGVVHEAALDRVGRSIGVLGTGIDIIYPKAHHELFGRMRQHGLLLSEFAPGAAPLARHFPVRNRIISGLALGIVVVEAASRSGSLITARLALEQGREVYAVPGPALDAHCLGSQELVRQGARPVFSADDVLQDMAAILRAHGCGRSEAPGAVKDLPEKDRPVAICPEASALSQTADRERLLQYLRNHGPVQADALSVVLECSAQELSSLLLGLEMLGEIRRLPGARYEALT
ncbi:MAG: DNA-processing protein DprA [Desulfovibrio sp.]|nr:DNA-processing protein DprA [Desulfovibrio sp.]